MKETPLKYKFPLFHVRKMETWGENCPEVPKKGTYVMLEVAHLCSLTAVEGLQGAQAGATPEETGCKELQAVPSTLLIVPSYYFFSVA